MVAAQAKKAWTQEIKLVPQHYLGYRGGNGVRCIDATALVRTSHNKHAQFWNDKWRLQISITCMEKYGHSHWLQ
eukprot:765880-Pelagomonas_calceolata.AAC.3